MHTTIEHIEAGDGQTGGAGAAQIGVEGQIAVVGRSAGAGHRDVEQGIGAEPTFVVGAVQANEGVVDSLLFPDIQDPAGPGR